MRGIDTPEQLQAWLAERGGARVIGHETPRQDIITPLPTCVRDATSHAPWWPYRSRTEQRYALLLEQWRQDDMLIRWRYEALRLRLAPVTTLTIDFMLTMPRGVGDGRIQLHETKGSYFREDGWQKLKQAAALYPEFRIFRVQWKQQQWVWQEVPSA